MTPLLVNRDRPGAPTRISDLRKQLRDKNIQLVVVKNSLARRATEGTPLAAAFDGMAEGSAGRGAGEATTSSPGQRDHPAADDKKFASFAGARRSDGWRALTADQVTAGQQVAQPAKSSSASCGPDPRSGSQSGQPIDGVGGALASQIKQKERRGRRSRGRSSCGRLKSSPNDLKNRSASTNQRS